MVSSPQCYSSMCDDAEYARFLQSKLSSWPHRARLELLMPISLDVFAEEGAVSVYIRWKMRHGLNLLNF